MSGLNNKGFLLADSLITVLIVSLSCFLCLGIYQAMNSFTVGYEEYIERSNNNLEDKLRSLTGCEACKIDEEKEEETVDDEY